MTTRFHIPRVSDAMARPRLFSLMDRRPCQLVMVTGQAAQGKSTLVASYLRNQDSPCLWFHLMPDVSDPLKFVDLLSDGMERLLRDKGLDGSLRLARATIGIREDLANRIDMVSRMIGRLESPLDLVLDDFEVLGDAGPAMAVIEELIRRTASRIFLLSRTLPSARFQRLKLERDILTITNQDLAFDRHETRDFFRDQSFLAPEDIDRILRITDGWAGGLILVSEAFRRSPSLSRLPSRLSSDAFSWFSREIYQTLASHIREFLMQTAIFDLLDIAVLDRFFDHGDAFDILTELEKRNLFVQRIEADRTRPVFKYNNLFREFLHQDMQESLTAASLAGLHRRAGRIYWDMKQPAEAVRHFTAAGAPDQVADIIRTKGTDYLITGRVETLALWLESLPGDYKTRDPWLIFFNTMCRRVRGGKKNIRAFAEALDRFRQAGETRGTLLCTAYLIEAGVFIREPSDRIREWIRAGEALLAAAGGSTRFAWARAILWQQIGLGYIAGTGNIPKGISACRNAMLLAKRIDHPDLLLNATVVLTLGFVQSGDFARARQMLDRIRTSRAQHPEYRALKRMTRVDYALKKGDLDLAKRLLEKSEQDIEKLGLIFLYPGFVEAMGIYYAGKGRFEKALQTAEHLSDFSVLEGNDFYNGISLRIQAHTHLLAGRYDRARTSADRAVQELSRSGRGDIHLFLARQIRGFAAFLAGDETDAAAAVSELTAVLAYFGEIAADQLFCETCFMAGLAASAVKDTNADTWLQDGFRIALEKGYTYFPLLDDTRLSEVMIALGIMGIDPVPFLKRLDGAGLDGDRPDGERNRSDRIKTCLLEAVARRLSGIPKRNRPGRAEILRPLYKWSLPEIKIHTLGEFQVFIGDTPLKPRAFGGTKPRSLLKAMVLNGSREIPREILIDSLWPDSSAAAGEKNFKINLHRIRKALEPDAHPDFGYSYILLKSGLVSLDPDLVILDTDRFLSLAAAAADLEDRGDVENALAAYTEAAGLYRGDYFSEDPYLDWISQRRDLFRSRYLDVLRQKALIQEDLGQWQAAVDTWQSVLETDPLSEPAVQNLMILYADANQKTRALNLFKASEQRLKQELDADPDPQTLAIYHRIKSR